MAGGAGLILRLQAAQKMGPPGVKTVEIRGGSGWEVVLPDALPGFVSRKLPIQDQERDFLPKDTSFGRRVYRAEDGFEVMTTVVLMGRDRSSIHRPEFCLTGQGFVIRSQQETSIAMARPHPYDLPVMKLTATKEVEAAGEKTVLSGLYVYWFVSKDRLTARHAQRMWWMAGRLLSSGELERWAYISCFALCRPGEEEQTYSRMKALIAGAVPEFQIAAGAVTSAAPPGEPARQ